MLCRYFRTVINIKQGGGNEKFCYGFIFLFCFTSITFAERILGTSNNPRQSAVSGTNTAPSGDSSAIGVYGQTNSNTGKGVYGWTTSRNEGQCFGVYGGSANPQGIGVASVNSAATGNPIGVWGQVSSPTGIGISGLAYSHTGANIAVCGNTKSPEGIGVAGYNNSNEGEGRACGVFGSTCNPNGYAAIFEGGKGIKIPVLQNDPQNPDSGTIWINSPQSKLKMKVGNRVYSLKAE